MKHKIKEPIKIRQKKLAGGNVSLYLSIYYNGKQSYEFLKLYLIPEVDKAAKERNRKTLELANSIKAKRVVELQSEAHGFGNAINSRKVKFFDFVEALAERLKKPDSDGNYNVWRCAIGHMKEYAGGSELMFSDITPQWVKGFRKYLDTATDLRLAHLESGPRRVPISQNTQRAYFIKLQACLNAAIESGIITTNPALGIKGPGKVEVERDYLTIDEVKALAATECEDHSTVKRAFLFSCLTGLRRCDIERITWGQLSELNGQARLHFRQKKTGGVEYLDITPQAVELMGERGCHSDDDKIFQGCGFSSASFTNCIIKTWAAKAGIKKHVTFHTGRHTFAVMMLTIGTDIYTTSKLLGHRSLKTTQVYAKIVDEKKREAVDRIPKIF